MIFTIEDLQTTTTSASGHVIDTAGAHRVIFEVRWSFVGAPAQLVFTPLGTNDSTIQPDVWCGFTAYPPNLVANGTSVDGTLQASGRGIIALVDPPRYVALDSFFSGTTGAVTIRAFCSV